MSEEIELQLLQENAELKERVDRLEGKNSDEIPIYNFSKTRDKDLKEIVSIQKTLSYDIFDSWFQNDIDIDISLNSFLLELIEENQMLIDSYNEEDLKIHFIVPLLNRIKFKSIKDNIRDFYENKIVYKTDKFILSGTTDFLVSKGLFETEHPYFFIQEFKRSEEYGNPRPQLLAELISAVELNNTKTIKGAYIIGAIWNFVVLEKLGKDKYQYFVSINFDSTKIEDLKAIYKNLMFVKNEILTMVRMENTL